MASCTPDSDDDTELEEKHARAVIKSAAEIWNLESRGIALRYGGWIDSDDPKEVCESFAYERPAVFVHFRDGCKDTEPADNVCDRSAWVVGTFQSIDDCDDEDIRQLIIFGDGDSPGKCEGSEVARWYTGTDESQWYDDLKATMVHEFGHTLNLDGDGSLSTPVPATVMQGDVTLETERHLYYWEKDCVDEFHLNNGRTVDYHVWEFLANGTKADVYEYDTTSRGLLSGGYWRHDDGPFYGLYYWWGTTVAEMEVNNAGFQWSEVLEWDEFLRRDVSPVFFSPLGPSGNYQFVSFVHARSSSNIDPPQALVAYELDLFQGGYGVYQLSQCDDSTCSSTTPLVSHLPMPTAIDPATGETVVARVNTDRSNSLRGSIVLHPGFSDPLTGTLREGARLDSGTVLPSENFNHWDYRRETDVAPAVACADPQAWALNYNCVLAWHDRGIPDGNVIVTYFSVNASNQIDWHGESYKVQRDAAETESHLSAAWFEGGIRVAWKSWHNPAEIAYARLDDSAYGSVPGLTVVDNRPWVLDPPTWLYHPQSDRGLAWTEFDDQ